MEITEAGGTGIAAAAPPTDGLRIRADFPDPPPPPPPAAEAPPVPPVPQKFTREIDLKDGSGVQKFEADTWEGLVDKLATAQEHATRKIKELSRKNITPDKEPPIRAKQLSEAEILALKEGFPADPIGTWNKLFEAQTGITVDQFRETQLKIAVADAERAFISKHKDDFLPCPENATKINKFLAEQELPVTTKNLEYAFYELGDQLQRKTVEPVLPPPPVPNQPPAPRVQEIPPPPVSIPANFGSRVEMQPGMEGVTAADYAQIAQLPPEQMKARIEQLFRQGKVTR